MKNVNTELWYVNKGFCFKPFHIVKAHIIDDDCNEYIATIAQDWVCKGYNKPEELAIVNLQPYDREEWKSMEDEVDYNSGMTKF